MRHCRAVASSTPRCSAVAGPDDAPRWFPIKPGTRKRPRAGSRAGCGTPGSGGSRRRVRGDGRTGPAAPSHRLTGQLRGTPTDGSSLPTRARPAHSKGIHPARKPPYAGVPYPRVQTSCPCGGGRDRRMVRIPLGSVGRGQDRRSRRRRPVGGEKMYDGPRAHEDDDRLALMAGDPMGVGRGHESGGGDGLSAGGQGSRTGPGGKRQTGARNWGLAKTEGSKLARRRRAAARLDRLRAARYGPRPTGL
jgi:hypothetical protein